MEIYLFILILAISAGVVGFMLQRPTPETFKDTHNISRAVTSACGHVGLPLDQLTPDFDLVRAGKLYEVLHHSAIDLGKDHELRTVQDVIDWLAEAPLNK